MPHTSDEAYQALYNDSELLLVLASPFELNSTEKLTDWNNLLETRQSILKLLEDYKSKGIENSLDAGVVLPDTKNEFKTFKLELADFFEFRVSVLKTMKFQL